MDVDENKITKDMKMGEIIEKHPETKEVFLEFGLMCAMCCMANVETLEVGAKAHGIDVSKLLKALNDSIKK